MKNRFIAAFIVLALFGACTFNKPKEMGAKSSEKLLGAYYFGAGYFTLVPQNIRHDLDEMKSWGTDLICIGITENDITYNKGNIAFIVDEAHQRGIKVFGVPSRMAGITAGQPIEPPLFGYHHPETAVLRKDGTPVVRKSHGILSSFYYPEVKEYFIRLTSQMILDFKLDGIIWDEPKSSVPEWQDFSQLALKNNPDSSFVKYMKDYADFFSDINAELKKAKPDLQIILFDEACRNDTVVEESAKIKGLDYFGTDGRPVLIDDTKITDNRSTKILHKYGERYLKAARSNGLKTMILVENQELTKHEVGLMDKAMPVISKMDVDLLLYYYYGFYEEDTEYKMGVTKKHIKKFKNN